MTKQIEVSDAVYSRFEERRKAMNEDHLPAMDPNTFLATLLDTAQAVDDGYYTQDHIPVDELQELVFEWLHNGYDKRHPNSEVAQKVNKARANDLESLIEGHANE